MCSPLLLPVLLNFPGADANNPSCCPARMQRTFTYPAARASRTAVTFPAVPQFSSYGAWLSTDVQAAAETGFASLVMLMKDIGGGHSRDGLRGRVRVAAGAEGRRRGLSAAGKNAAAASSYCWCHRSLVRLLGAGNQMVSGGAAERRAELGASIGDINTRTAAEER
jgi:hypothetical protein